VRNLEQQKKSWIEKLDGKKHSMSVIENLQNAV
jgi:hypothetical protein